MNDSGDNCESNEQCKAIARFYSNFQTREDEQDGKTYGENGSATISVIVWWRASSGSFTLTPTDAPRSVSTHPAGSHSNKAGAGRGNANLDRPQPSPLGDFVVERWLAVTEHWVSGGIENRHLHNVLAVGHDSDVIDQFLVVAVLEKCNSTVDIVKLKDVFSISRLAVEPIDILHVHDLFL